MRAALILALIILAGGGAAHAAADGPIGPAREGQLQCYQPDAARKTCRSLAGYNWDAQGAITNRAEVMVAPDPLVVMISRTTVTVRGDAVCGVLRAEDFDAAEITVSGAPASPEVAANVRRQVNAAMASALGHEFCTSYAPAQDGFQASVAIDGTAHPEMSAPLIWVKPGEGYKVAP